MNVMERVRAAGVVGAGGAGFPTHVKLNAQAEFVIANGAECEPLLRCDRELMQRSPERIVRGMELAMEATGAVRGVIATKAHYEAAVKALRRALGERSDIQLHLMESNYPSGDEKSLIYEVTGRVVPGAKLPADVGCVVSNVATLCNIASACDGAPVITRDVTICGDVPAPQTVTAPIGTPARELLVRSGFSGTEEEYALIMGGPCMGRQEHNWDAPVTKTTGGLLLLKKTHPLIVKRTLPPERRLRLARAVCCQCSQCTQLCPRNALGLHVQPHKAMRALTTGNAALLGDPLGVLSCSGCGLCTYYACFMGLAPSVAMAELKAELARAGVKAVPEAEIRPDPFLAQKRVPVARLIARMGLSSFDVDAPYAGACPPPARVRIPLRQHVGAPCRPVVQPGDAVRAGDVIGEIPEKALGARVHASISGTVTQLSGDFIEITGGERG